jgi:hypothetical protein
VWSWPTRYIPSELGYGDNGSPPKIMGGDVLVFQMEIIEIKGDTVPASRCDPKTLEGCDDKEKAFVETVKGAWGTQCMSSCPLCSALFDAKARILSVSTQPRLALVPNNVTNTNITPPPHTHTHTRTHARTYTLPPRREQESLATTSSSTRLSLSGSTR